MVTLGIDLTLPEGSVAVAEGSNVLSVISWGNPKMHAELVFAKVRDCLTTAGLKLEDIDRIVVTSGPGSFTGVRLSVTVGKSFKVSGFSVFSISTLKALTDGLNLGNVAAIIPARRNRFYTLIDGVEEDLTEEEILEKIEGKILVYRGDLPERLSFLPSVREITPLAVKAALASENRLEPLRFHYIRNHDAKKL